MTDLERSEMAAENVELMAHLSNTVVAGIAWFLVGATILDADIVERLNTRLKLGADGYAKKLVADYDAVNPTFTEIC